MEDEEVSCDSRNRVWYQKSLSTPQRRVSPRCRPLMVISSIKYRPEYLLSFGSFVHVLLIVFCLSCG